MITRSPELQATLDQLLQLSPEDRLELGDCLLASVAGDDMAAAWEDEIDRRMALLESGEAKTVPAEVVMAEVRKIIDEAR
ncbi:MAG TPA: addiction module protein [Planctomycetaceae bacterium]|nr:addiction module protein [Planctomycetaceae bacterium]